VKSDDSRKTGPLTIIGHGNVVGDHSKSDVDISVTESGSEEALAALDEFIRRLALYENSIRDSHRVWEDAMAARMEMAQAAPKWERVRSILKRVATGVAGIATLTDLINNALSLVPHL
jgi:hypothetical protein